LEDPSWISCFLSIVIKAHSSIRML
jgi:hypothetical protein